MRRLLALVAAGGVTLALLAGCGPQGQPCGRAGDIKVVGGWGYSCVASRRGNTWQ